MAKIKKILMPLFIVLGFFVTAGNIHAASLNPNDYITKVTLTDANGSPISGPVQSGSIIGIDVQWTSSDAHPIKSGDTLTIPLTVSGSNINIATYTKQGSLVTPSGTNIGRYNIENGKITMNFDDGVSGLQQNSISGEVKLKAMVTMNSSSGSSASTNVNVGSQTVTVTAQNSTTSGNGIVITDTSKPQISKSGLKEQSNGTIKWVASTTVPKDEQEATITDTVGPGQLLDFSSLRINVIGIGEMTAQQFQDQGLGTVTQTSTGFTIKFNMAGVQSFAEKHNVSGIALQLAYLTRSDFTYTGDFTNTINLTVKDSQNKEESYDSTAQTSNITSSVTVTGIPNTMQFMKRDQVTLAPLSGAQFTIKGTDEGENDVSSYSTTVTSDENGIVKVGNLQPGIYTVNETKAPAGYSIDSNTYYFKINSDGTATGLGLDADDPDMDITNILDLPHPQSFSITKENTDGATLPGAEFGLYNSEGELVQNMNSDDGLYTTNYQGKATFDIYADGSYTLKEVKAPAGYDVNSKVYNVVMKNGSISTDLGSGNVIIDKKASSSSSIKSSSSSKKSSSSLVKSSSSSKKATVASSLSKKATVASSSSKEVTVVSNSTNKSSQNTETSVKVPSKASTISYVNKSTQVSVPVVVSSKANTMVESSISSEINNGSSSTSVVNKPTLVSSSMDIPVRSWSNSIKDESSAVVTGTTVSTYSQSRFANKDVNKSTSNTATTQNTAVINNTNSHSTNQGGVVVAGNNNNDNNAQGNKSDKDNNRGEGLPQTGEVAATAVIGLGVVLIAVSGLVLLKKKNS